MTRSLWKGPFVERYLMKKVEKLRLEPDVARKSLIKIYSRRSMIIPDFVGLSFGVYNGREFIPVFVVEDMVGKKFGEFSPTRTFKGHAGDKKVKKK